MAWRRLVTPRAHHGAESWGRKDWDAPTAWRSAELLAESLSYRVEDEKKVARRPGLAHHRDLREGLHFLVGYVMNLAQVLVLNEAIPGRSFAAPLLLRN